MAISQLDPLISAEKSVGRLGECSTHHGQGGLIRMVAEWVGPWLGEWLMNGVVHWFGSFSIWRTLEDAISHPKKRGHGRGGLGVEEHHKVVESFL